MHQNSLQCFRFFCSFKGDCYRCIGTEYRCIITRTIHSYLSHKRFCVLQDGDEGNSQAGRQELHLDQLLPGAGEGKHSGYPSDHQVLTGATGQGLRVPSCGRPSHHLQTQVVGQQSRCFSGCGGGVCHPALVPEASQGAVERVLYPCRLAGRQERTEAHGVSYPGEDVARLILRRAGLRGAEDGQKKEQQERSEAKEMSSPVGKAVGPESRERHHAAAPTHNRGGLGSAQREMA